jgi:hypothetical protein
VEHTVTHTSRQHRRSGTEVTATHYIGAMFIAAAMADDRIALTERASAKDHVRDSPKLSSDYWI